MQGQLPLQALEGPPALPSFSGQSLLLLVRSCAALLSASSVLCRASSLGLFPVGLSLVDPSSAQK